MAVGSRVSGEPGIVLHVRPYRETSAIVSLLTPHHGRVAGVARGVRGTRRGSPVQPFSSLVTGWSGRGGLVTLTNLEPVSQPLLKGDSMNAAFYVVELVTRLVAEGESAPRIFAALSWALDSLSSQNVDLLVTLRSFEKLLLEELGYGLDFRNDASTGEPIACDAIYELDVQRGFVPTRRADGIKGGLLLEIAEENFETAAARQAAKKIFRVALGELLGPKPLTSRRLLIRDAKS
jgi:DNA repair protein RecO (recombination protein O)